MPSAQRIGLLYSTADSNDHVLFSSYALCSRAKTYGIIAIPIDEGRDIPLRMQQLKGKIDFLYVGASGPIQPALPIISRLAAQMNIPVFNLEEHAVAEGLALASFGVNYTAVGKNTAQLTAAILHGSSIADLKPLYPRGSDYHQVINKAQAAHFDIAIPKNATVVEG